MKPTVLVSAVVLSSAASTGAFPIVSSILGMLGLPPGWEWRDDVQHKPVAIIPIPEASQQQLITQPSKCIQRCLDSEYKRAGCATAGHWDCLCRSDGLAPEVRGCAENHCRTEEDVANLKLQQVACQRTNGFYTGRDAEEENWNKKNGYGGGH